MAALDATLEINLRSLDNQEEYQERIIVLTPGVEHRIGRSSKNLHKNLLPASNNLLIDSPVISRDHAVLFADIRSNSLKAYIRDLKSTHGTSVNNSSITPDANIELKNGDILQFGSDLYRNDTPPVVAKKYQFESKPATMAGNRSPSRVFSVPEMDSSEDEIDVLTDSEDEYEPRGSSTTYLGYGSQSNPVDLDDVEEMPPKPMTDHLEDNAVKSELDTVILSETQQLLPDPKAHDGTAGSSLHAVFEAAETVVSPRSPSPGSPEVPSGESIAAARQSRFDRLGDDEDFPYHSDASSYESDEEASLYSSPEPEEKHPKQTGGPQNGEQKGKAQSGMSAKESAEGETREPPRHVQLLGSIRNPPVIMSLSNIMAENKIPVNKAAEVSKNTYDAHHPWDTRVEHSKDGNVKDVGLGTNPMPDVFGGYGVWNQPPPPPRPGTRAFTYDHASNLMRDCDLWDEPRLSAWNQFSMNDHRTAADPIQHHDRNVPVNVGASAPYGMPKYHTFCALGASPTSEQYATLSPYPTYPPPPIVLSRTGIPLPPETPGRDVPVGHNAAPPSERSALQTPVSPELETVNNNNLDEEPKKSRTRVSITEIVEEAPQQPPTPTSERELKRKADALDEDGDEAHEVPEAADSPNDVPEPESKSSADTGSSEMPAVQARPTKRIRLQIAASAMAGAVVGGIGVLGALISLPDSFFQ